MTDLESNPSPPDSDYGAAPPPPPTTAPPSSDDLGISPWAVVGLSVGGLILFFALMTGMILVIEHNGGRAPSGAGVVTNDAAGPALDIDVSLTEFAITPSTVNVPGGARVTFHVTNNGTMPHNFTLDT